MERSAMQMINKQAGNFKHQTIKLLTEFMYYVTKKQKTNKTAHVTETAAMKKNERCQGSLLSVAEEGRAVGEERWWGSAGHVSGLRCAVDAVLAGGAIVIVLGRRAIAGSRGRYPGSGVGWEAWDSHLTGRGVVLF